MPRFFPIKKAQFPYSFHSFACLRYFYITYVKHSCPLKSKMFSRSVVAVISQACDTSIDKLYLRSSRQQRDISPTFGHEISGQCIILVFLLKKKKNAGFVFEKFGFYILLCRNTVEMQWNPISVHIWGQKDEWGMICALQELSVQYESKN